MRVMVKLRFLTTNMIRPQTSLSQQYESCAFIFFSLYTVDKKIIFLFIFFDYHSSSPSSAREAFSLLLLLLKVEAESSSESGLDLIFVLSKKSK